MTAYKNLSAYTFPANCSDLTDCQDGYNELSAYLLRTPTAPKSARIRFAKIADKLDAFKAKQV